ncbi:MAG: DNA-directed RNA polymerase subunit N [Candidatus Diapherotrites archaeon]|uniref:DNA-directed RNA polymerase subunit Rpo10 n=1 Tax=Candidatus Iainarchaeum sp. TaxID=3101447 RepID=A0A8T4L5J0_9ARCH|nr:DNA-directed RNA polymerase subunit N [Candidatus Diapherotrites archaeon]
MIVPVRCFSCNKVIADQYEEYAARIGKGENPEKVLDDLGLSRYCCRRMLLTHVDLMPELLKYEA